MLLSPSSVTAVSRIWDALSAIPKIDVPSYSVCLVVTNCKLPCENYGVFVIATPSPFVFYPISCTEIRCLVDVPSRNLPSVSDGEMADYLKTQVAPKVPPQLYTGFISAIEKKGNIRIMPNKIMADAPYSTPGAILIGDAFNMRHALTGGGVTVALSDVVFTKGSSKTSGRPIPSIHHLQISRVLLYSEEGTPMSSTINALANLLHKVLSASSDPAMEDIQQACFDYETWRRIRLRTIGSALRFTPSSIKLGIPFLGHCNLYCWPNVTFISFSQTFVEWS
ncbi:Squalene epoxidase 3 [Hibiscus syriacus]|uniref:Squalene monooxygenase n=1 Tax=Hibiscus syriacus TaxID=106335 RepID=A0A6A3CD89_HIBSY|nr:Squalene epoxidase 3 [Hibiscus syriacus]